MSQDVSTMVHIIDEIRVGGAQTHLHTILRELIRTYKPKHEVISLFGEGVMRESFEEIGVKVTCFDFREDLKKFRFNKIMNDLATYFKTIDSPAIESHMTWSRIFGTRAAQKSGIDNRFAFEQGDIYLKGPHIRLLNFANQFQSKAIICCSNSLKQLYCKRNLINPSKVTVLHNCLDPSKFSHSGDLDSKPKDEFVFVGAGTLGSGVNKRFDVMIRAMAELKTKTDTKFRLKICGDGDQREMLENLALDLGVEDRVNILGMVKDVGFEFATSNAFLHCSPYEPFGIVAIEAMYHHLPCILPRAGGMPEIFQDGECGEFYQPLNHTELAEKMHKLVNNQSLCNEYGQKGRKTVEQDFLVSTYVEKLMSTYKLSHLKSSH